MTNLGWVAPAQRVDACTARRGILWQHERIRGQLARARAIADAALGAEATGEAVATAIADLRSTMEVHLAFEERVLIPLLSDDLPVGPLRAAHLVEEHAQQRAMLAALHREACGHPELPTLAVKLGRLTAWLLDDMNEEERALINPEACRDDIVVVDQTCG